MRWKHTVLLVPVAFFLGVLTFVPAGLAEDKGAPSEGEAPAFTEVTPESEAAVAKGLQFLASKQEKNGSFGTQFPVAVTSLACLAFMADGNLPGRGKYGEQVYQGINYILLCAGRNMSGFINEGGGNSSSRMHGHGFATLLLAEVYGMTHNTGGVEVSDLEAAIQKAIKVIETAQTGLGGWGYDPSPSSDEASITICVVQALRSARNAGITVGKYKKNVIEKGIEYIKKCKNRDGSYRYSLSMGATNSSFALTAGAVASLAFLGQQDSPEYKAGIEYMNKFKPPRARDGGHYFYENFYATLAMFYAGDRNWAEWYPPMRDEIVKLQDKSTGKWPGEICEEYCTAFGCLVLEVPHRYLPIYQR